MKILLLLLAAAAFVTPRNAGADEAGASAGEPRTSLKVRVKSALQSSRAEPPADAPFLRVQGEPVLDLVPAPEDPRLKESRSSCSRAGKVLCYDSASGKIVYRKTREFMPDIPGFRAENISLRRDRVTFRYSFQ